MVYLLTALIVLAVFALDFLGLSGIYWVVCWAFGLTFTWPIALAIWLVTLVLAGIFKGSRR